MSQTANDNPEISLSEFVEFARHELRCIVARRLNQAGGQLSYTPTDLLHETYLRLSKQRFRAWETEDEFFAAFATTCRRVLIDYLRARRAQKRGGHYQRVALETAGFVDVANSAEILELDDALTELEKLSPERAQIVVLKYYGGLSDEAISKQLDVDRSTIQRHCRSARAWLAERLREHE